METLFFVSLLFVVYAYAGYPALAICLARLFPRPVRKEVCEPDVSIVIIAHNEEHRIAGKLENCLSLDYPADRLEVVVASDGSTDKTNEIVTSFEGRGVRLLAFGQRRGKAACLNDAIAGCTSEIVVLADTRQIIASEAITKLMRNFADPSVGAVSGELIFTGAEGNDFSAGVDFYWRYEKAIRKSESAFDSVIGATGALYAIRRSLFESIPAGTILDDVLIPMNITRSGHRVVFESEAIVTDTPSAHPDQERARKIRTSAGNYQLLFRQPWLVSPVHNRLALQFFSHKLARLFAPFLLCTALVSNALIASESPVYKATLLTQLACYWLAVAGIVWPRAERWRLVTVPKAFLLLNWFAVLGLVEAATNRRAFLWR